MTVLITLEEILGFAYQARDAYNADAASISIGSHSFKCIYNADDKSLTIAIRGSDTAEEWFLNAAMPFAMLLSKVNFDERDHRFAGDFCSTLDSFSYFVIARKMVHYALENYQEAKKIDICGHSRGGLLSVFCGMLLSNRQDINVRVFAYGAPKLYYSSQDLCFDELEELQSKIVWVEHEKDFVPAIANTVRETVATDRLDSCLTGFESIVLKNPHVGLAHSMINYIAGIQDLIAKRRDKVKHLATNIANLLASIAETDPLSDDQLFPAVEIVELVLDIFKVRK